MTIHDRAGALLARGDRAGAVAVARAAADRGDVDALYLLACWQLVGHPLPRDVPAARLLLRQAVAIRHVDAALMEVAFTANGSGGAADWPGALSLLRTAAAGDPVAAEQLALVERMAIDGHGLPAAPPPAPRVLSQAPAVHLFAGLLSRGECLHLAQAGDPLLAPTTVIDPRTGRTTPHPVRTSHGAVLGPANEDLAVQALNRRLAAATGTDWRQGEPLTILRYAPGQQYRPHHDAIAGAANQRMLTALVYLNEGYGGGETRFPHLGLSVRGRIGDVLVFDNLRPDGTPDPRALHEGMALTAGHKWLATRWIRQRPYDPWNAGS